jgi:predicted metal-dependent peptidase
MQMTPCALTADQENKWEQTRCALLWHCPAFAHIFYEMLNNSGSKHIAIFTKDVPIAATDGANLIVNPDTFFQYDLNERVFICAHEIAHGIFDHMGMMHRFKMQGKISYDDGTTLEYDHETMNYAMDYVINDMLIESNVGKFNKDWLHDKALGTAQDSAVDVYKAIYKQQNGKGGKGSGTGKGFDQHLAPGTSQGKDPQTAVSQRNDSQWKTAIAAAAAAAKAVGKLPAGLERFLIEMLEPQVPWQEHLQSMFSRRVGGGTYDWRRADRRLIVRDIYAPGRSGFGAGTVVVGVDTSGSIGDKELTMFFSEMYGILENVKPKELVVIWCDAAVNRVDYCHDVSDLLDLRCKGAPGGGGTSFIPVFDKIDELGLEPEGLVYLTDGMGSFPNSAPSYPVIWGNIYPQSKYPFGDVVDVPKQAA